MIKLKKLLYESLLKEALPLSVAKRYASIEQNPSIKKKLDEIFNKLKSLPDAKSSKRGERIYIPYESSDVKSSTKDEIEDVISKQGYKVKDYVKGIATDKLGRDVKIGKVLNKLKQPNLLNAFNTDTVRNASTNSEGTYIVFSRHSYDMAGMSTDRDWRSCMNIYDGMYRKHVQYDVSEGSFIAYYVNIDDLNINKPIGRIVIKPFVSVKDKSDVVYSTVASKPYGNPPSGFEAMITKILDDIQNEQTGAFGLKSQLYCDTGRDTKLRKLPKNKKIQNKSDVIEILDSFEIKNYTVNEDLSVDVDGDVNISYSSLTEIPVKFGKVIGKFYCRNNNLTSLKGAPEEVDYFDCSNNKLTSLEGAPKRVEGNFTCGENNLISLDGAPKRVEGHFTCRNNNLTSLEGSPKYIGGNFYCRDNNLTSLEGSPKYVGGNFNCINNKLTNLKGAPTEVGRGFECSNNKLTSLEGAPEKVTGDFNCSENELTSLEGAPKEVGKGFYCDDNQLTSLEGAPKRVEGHFNCRVNNLTSLEGSPKYVGGRFNCSINLVKFTVEDVLAVSNVKGTFIV